MSSPLEQDFENYRQNLALFVRHVQACSGHYLGNDKHTLQSGCDAFAMANIQDPEAKIARQTFKNWMVGDISEPIRKNPNIFVRMHNALVKSGLGNGKNIDRGEWQKLIYLPHADFLDWLSDGGRINIGENPTRSFAGIGPDVDVDPLLKMTTRLRCLVEALSDVLIEVENHARQVNQVIEAAQAGKPTIQPELTYNPAVLDEIRKYLDTLDFYAGDELPIEAKRWEELKTKPLPITEAEIELLVETGLEFLPRKVPFWTLEDWENVQASAVKSSQADDDESTTGSSGLTAPKEMTAIAVTLNGALP